MNPQLYTAYPTNNTLRRSFCRLAEQTFGIDFEPWYQAGFWGEQYLPYSLVENGEVIANVSVNIMDMCLHGQQKHFIQLGTVMTEEAHRGQGLSRFLMERILEEWKPQCDGVYLFANDSVLNFLSEIRLPSGAGMDVHQTAFSRFHHCTASAEAGHIRTGQSTPAQAGRFAERSAVRAGDAPQHGTGFVLCPVRLS